MKVTSIKARDCVIDNFEIDVKFSDGTSFEMVTLWMKEFVGDTKEELADSFQIWVDAIREGKHEETDA